MYLELSVGQFTSHGPVRAWVMVKMFKGIMLLIFALYHKYFIVAESKNTLFVQFQRRRYKHEHDKQLREHLLHSNFGLLALLPCSITQQRTAMDQV